MLHKLSLFFKRETIRMVTALYRGIFAKSWFYGLNKQLFFLSLRSLGILNFENDRVSGEDFFVRSLSRCLPKRDSGRMVVLDVGANVGLYSNKVKKFYPDAEIYAFEPHPKTFKRLQHEALKQGYKALNLACGRMRGCLKLYDYRGSKEEGSSHASLCRDVIEQLHGSESTAWDVQVTTIDHFVEEEGIKKVHLLKIDTEGYEFNVLSGAKESIEKGVIDIIQFEFNEMNIFNRVFFKDFYDILRHYNFYRILPGGLIPLGSYSPLLCEIFAYQNIVAIRMPSCAPRQ